MLIFFFRAITGILYYIFSLFNLKGKVYSLSNNVFTALLGLKLNKTLKPFYLHHCKWTTRTILYDQEYMCVRTEPYQQQLASVTQ